VRSSKLMRAVMCQREEAVQRMGARTCHAI
jgi:hypothetical protein